METNDIFNKFRLLAQAKNEVKLFNDYKGIPLELDAAISNVFGNTVTFSVYKYQFASFAFKKQMFIQNDLFPEIIKARIKEIDIAKGVAILTDFEYVPVPIVKRKSVRTQPENSIEAVIFKYGGEGVKAELIDISDCGIGVYSIMSLPVNTKVYIHLQLPGAETKTRLKLELSGVVVNTVQEVGIHGGIRYRIGMQTFSDERTKQIITEYVSQRQAKLLNELKRYYEEHSLQ